MMTKLFDSELKIMNIIWEEGDCSAKQLAIKAKQLIGWNKTTTYTVIRKCLTKGAIERTDPDWICHALITKEQVQEYETTELINKLYNGEMDQLISDLLNKKII